MSLTGEGRGSRVPTGPVPREITATGNRFSTCWNDQASCGAVCQLSRVTPLAGRPASSPITRGFYPAPDNPPALASCCYQARSLLAVISRRHRSQGLAARPRRGRGCGRDQGRPGVLAPDGVDEVPGPDGERPVRPRRAGLEPPLGHQDAQVGAFPAVVARAVDAQEERLGLILELMPVQRRPPEDQRAVGVQEVLAGLGGGVDPLHYRAGLLD